jgi:hypothetical protein
MNTITDNQFDQLLSTAINAVDHQGLLREDITPSEVYQWIQDDTLQDAWDALTYKEQDAVCYDLRDQVIEAEIMYQEYLRSDEYMELQYA